MVEEFDAVFGGAVVSVQRHHDAAAGLRVIGLQLAQPLCVIGAHPAAAPRKNVAGGSSRNRSNRVYSSMTT